MTLPELIELYIAQRRALNYSQAWFVHARLALEPFARLADVQDVLQLTAGHLEKYRLWLHENKPHLTKVTRHRRLTMVCKMLRWAAQRSLLVHDPGLAFSLDKRPPYLLTRFVPSLEEVERLIEAPDCKTLIGRRDRFLWELFYGTGLRRKEVHRLQIHDYHRETRTLSVRLGKGSKDREIPLGNRLVERIEDYLATIRPALEPPAEETAFIIDCEGGRLGGNAMYVRLYDYVNALGMPRFCLHSLRHAYASHLLEGGATLQEVGRLLGHSNLSTTETYTHIHPRELLREYRRTHPRARRRRR